MAVSKATAFNQQFLLSLNSRKAAARLPYCTASNSSNSLPFLSSSLPVSSPAPGRCIARVSTAPVEFAPPAPDPDINQEISRLKALRLKLSNCRSLEQKIGALDCDPRVKHFFSGKSFGRVLATLGLGLKESSLVKCLVAAGQEHVLELGFGLMERDENVVRTSMKNALHALVEMIEKWDVHDDGHKGGKGLGMHQNGIDLDDEEVEDFQMLLKTLEEIEEFFDCVGGVIGYQIMVLELLQQSTVERQTTNSSQHLPDSMQCQFLEIHAPTGVDLSKNTEYALQAALWGIEGLHDLGEIYPLGGSADRLGLVDPETGECLPAAMLPYGGRTLLEGLIRDLQAREYLYFKLYGKQCITPVAIMTSAAKNNHKHITLLCERLGWFGRGRSSFKLFEQPLVPTVRAVDGQWLVRKPFVPVCKPGGHGVIWKLAYDNGVFQWFYDHGRKGATVRQVSNVVAATDVTLLALAGIGLHHEKKLGFASCKRNPGATEGVNVLIEKKNFDGKWAYGLSCIEYTEFDKFGATRGLSIHSSSQAQFPANTNILYVDLPSAELVGSDKTEKSLPGMVLNVKKAISYVDPFGNQHCISGGRLECTMQNIADSFLNTCSSRCYSAVEDNLDTFIVYNERRRVTSSAKKKRNQQRMSLHQTPDGALLDIQRNAYDLLSSCDITTPEVEGNEKYVDSGPPFLIFLHPALGPIWEIIRQKFKGGSISKGSELQIDVAEFSWKNVQLDGSMIIIADNVMGSTRLHENNEPMLQYGHRCGRCRLHNVKVLNDGIDWNYEGNVYWKHDVQRFETFKVILHGNAEFEASNIVIQGNHVYEVPDGHRLKITSGDAGLEVQLKPIEENMINSGSWYWNYSVQGCHIRVEMVEL